MATMNVLVNNTVPVAEDFNENFDALNQAIGTGTTITQYATGDIVYASAANTLSRLAVGTNTAPLVLASGIPAWNSASNPMKGVFHDGTAGAPSITFATNTTSGFYLAAAADFRAMHDSAIIHRFRTSGSDVISEVGTLLAFDSGTTDIFLLRDSAGVLAIRNSTNAMGLHLYNTYTSGSNYERGVMKWASNVLHLGTEAATGTVRSVNLGTAGNEGLLVAHTASAVTYLQLTPGATTVAPVLKSAGETNVGLKLQAAGTGNLTLESLSTGDVIVATNSATRATFNASGLTMGTNLPVTAAVLSGAAGNGAYYKDNCVAAWGRTSGGATPSLGNNFNIASVTDTTTGTITWTIAADLTTIIAVVATLQDTNSALIISADSLTGGSFITRTYNTSDALTDPAGGVNAVVVGY